MGRVADKFVKNVARKRRFTPGVESLVPTVLSGDRGLTLIENAAWGVVASVTPSDQPGRHHHQQRHQHDCRGKHRGVCAPPGRQRSVTARGGTLINEAVVAAGGPRNVITTVTQSQHCHRASSFSATRASIC
jgi:aldehyde dehydrogenase